MLKIEKEIITSVSSGLQGNDAEFFERVWQSPMDVYYQRLRAINFYGADKVLDAGFGFGQWTLPLAELNHNVVGIEYDDKRKEVVEKLTKKIGVNNLSIRQGNIEKIPLESESFDLIFCYSVIFLTDFRKTISEFYRLLKPSGKLYFTANDLGWYLFCLQTEHNKSDSYDPAEMATNTIHNSLNYYAHGSREVGQQLIMTKSVVQEELDRVGFKAIEIEAEGSIQKNPDISPKSFYEGASYLGYPKIYECLTVK